jgi:hypothetical protein
MGEHIFSEAVLMRREDHPVWTVYDKLRTARLNVKYYSRQLQKVERRNFFLELVLLVTAPSSAVAGLWFWDTEIGKIAWQQLGIVAAITAVVKPLLNLSRRIKEYESVLAGYRGLEFDLMEIKSMVEQKQTYDKSQKDELQKAMRREKSLVTKGPETRENVRVLKRCQNEVESELPADSFFVPEN